MNLGDKSRATTAEDIIRRYNLDSLKTDRKNISSINTLLNRQYILIKKFVSNVTLYKPDRDLNAIWFYNGVPTLANDPFVNFSEEERINKVGNLYYDRDTGYVYQLELIENEFNWKKIDDNNLIESLALANSEADTYDNKRNIFYNLPITPYEAGDIWLNESVIMRCRCTREAGEFSSTDWIVHEEYTDESVLLETRAVLDEFKKEVTTNYVSTSALEINNNQIYGYVAEKTTEISGEVTKQNEKIAEIEVEAQKIGLSVEQKLKDVADSDGNVTSASIILAVNNDTSSAVIDADKVSLKGKEINLTSDNTTIKSTNLSVDKEGNLTCKNASINGTVTSNNVNITGGVLNIGSNFGVDNGGNLRSKRLQSDNIQVYSIQSSIQVDGNYTWIVSNETGFDITPDAIKWKKNNTVLPGTGIFSNGDIVAHNLTAMGKISGELANVACGVCTLSTEADTYVSFGKTFPSAPKVVLTCIENNTAICSANIVAIDQWGFTAYIAKQGNTFTGKQFNWIAVWQ